MPWTEIFPFARLEGRFVGLSLHPPRITTLLDESNRPTKDFFSVVVLLPHPSAAPSFFIKISRSEKVCPG
jgi:hypothetical protein